MYLDYMKETEDRRDMLSIAMLTDFFYPRLGGVETHVYALAQCLIRLGHRLVVVTSAYGEKGKQRQGVRYMPRGLKVYYLPFSPFYRGNILYTGVGCVAILRDIFTRESVQIMHGHSAFSGLAMEAISLAKLMGIPTLLTDHSLFGFADLSSVTYNLVLTYFLSPVDRVICVSHIGKENMVLRANLDPSQVYVIPNALESSHFQPASCNRNDDDSDFVTIVFVSRLVYRKGIDLLVAIIPPLCKMFDNLRFLIVGDGPYRLNLEEVRERHQLHARVDLLGALNMNQVHKILIQGDIFLNTSLTEAFCIAILEAVACGLLVVSTSVGGIPEVLPEQLIRLAKPKASDLVQCLASVVREVIAEKTASSTSPGHISSLDKFLNQCYPDDVVTIDKVPYSHVRNIDDDGAAKKID